MSFSLKIYLWYELWIFLIINYEWGIISNIGNVKIVLFLNVKMCVICWEGNGCW